MRRMLLAKRSGAVAAFLCLAFAAGGCATEEPVPTLPPPPATLSAPDTLLRASMALRGIRPSVGEIEKVVADSSSLEGIVDGYLDSAAFGKVMRDLHNEALLTRTDYAFFPAGFPSIGPLSDVDAHTVNTSIQEAPLRLVEHVITNDRPYSEVVTADYQIGNPITATVWGTTYDQDGEPWQEVRFADGRPTAGVLSDPWVFTRHSSTVSNANRGRANAISKAFLCYDFLSRDIEIDSSIDLADPAVVKNAVVDNEACASCHQALDPLASFFGDYFPIYVAAELESYPFAIPTDDPEVNIPFYVDGLFGFIGVELRDPAYFGQAGDDVRDLGAMMAEDPRFALCAVQRFYSYFHQIPQEQVPLRALSELTDGFIDSGLDAKALAKAIVLRDDFAASHSDDIRVAATLAGIKKARPDQLTTMFADLTGFVWETHIIDEENMVDLGRVDLTTDSFLGFEVLGGGIDAQYVTRPAHTYNASSTLLLEALAKRAAPFVVERDFATAPEDRRLLTGVEPEDIEEEVVRAQLVWLHKRLFAEVVEADSTEIDETYQLFETARGSRADATRAWTVTLTAMLQDHRMAMF